MYKLVKYKEYGLLYTKDNQEQITSLFITDIKVAQSTAYEYSQLKGVTGVKILERSTIEKIIRLK